MFIPYRVDVPYNHRPVMNWLLFISVVAVFVITFLDLESYQKYFLNGWNLEGLFGHMFLHANVIHLVGNLILLWLFGNAICSRVGNIFYLPIYLLLGLFAAAIHNIFSGGSMIGASGAISGIVGMYLVLFPENTMDCFFLLFFKPIYFSLSGYWLIFVWFAFDILGVMHGEGNIAYYAHIGGFLGGFGLASLLLKYKLIVFEEDEKSIYDVILKRHKNTKISQEESEFWKRELEKAELKGNHPISKEPIIIKPKVEFLRFHCSCGQKIKVPKTYAGKKGRCPKCKDRLLIPNE